jgi:hypothetical protein
MFKWLNNDSLLIRQMLDSQTNITIGSEYRIYELYNFYKQEFTHSKNDLDQTNKVWICPKFNGQRMIGILYKNCLQVFNIQIGLKTFHVQNKLFIQRLIVQIEYFETDNTFIITEILGLSMNTYRETFSSNALRNECNNFFVSTWQKVSVFQSISWINYMIEHFPCLKPIFTHHVEVAGINYNYQIIDDYFTKKFDSDWKLLPIDGWLLIDELGHYFKVKPCPTVELKYIKIGKMILFQDAQGIQYKNIKLTSNQCAEIVQHSQSGIVEFTLPNFRFKCIRNDKTVPDSTRKIDLLLLNSK